MSDMSITPRRVAPGDGIFTDENTAAPVVESRNPLDDPKARNLHRSLMGHYQREIDRQRTWRRDMEKDEAIYDGIGHWTEAEKAILQARGQLPLVFNVSHTAVNWLLGSQRRQPMDYKIMPRTKAPAAAKHAEIKTGLLKYLGDVWDNPMMCNQAFAGAVKAGLGWLETGAQAEDDGEPVYERFESWRNVIHDTAAVEMDLSDARYIFRTKWIDTDRALAMFEDRQGVIYQSASDVLGLRDYADEPTGDSAMDSRERAGDDYGRANFSGRRRVRLYECWHRTPTKGRFMRGGEFSGEPYAEGSDRHEWAIQHGRSEVVTATKETVHVSLFCDRGMLWTGLSPYRHNKFPFTPVWGYRRESDGAAYGLIRNVRDLQIDLNKRASKSLWHSTARTAWVPEGSIEDIEAFREEVHRPDAIHVYKNVGGPRPEIVNDLQHAAVQADLMASRVDMIERSSGVTGENTGIRGSNGQSGKAIIALQDQGELTTNSFFENLRFARKKHGEKLLANVEQFYTAEKVFRITNERGAAEFVEVNSADPTVDDYITRSRADFIVSEEAYRASQRQQQSENLIKVAEMIAGAGSPEMAVRILPLIIKRMDVPHADEIVKRMNSALGITDPDADPNAPLSPEEQAERTIKQLQQQLQMRGAEAEVANIEAQAKERAAKAEATIAGLAKTDAETVNAYSVAFGAAVNAAMALGAMPQLAQAADGVIEEATRRAEAAKAGQTPGPVTTEVPQLAPPPGPAMLPPPPAPAAPAPAF